MTAFPRLACLLVLLASLVSSVQAQELPVPKPAEVASGPRVAIETSLGRIVVELYPAKAPRTVENFLGYVRDGHYNGTVFHRVVTDLLIQAGAYTPDLQFKPERAPVPNEAGNGLSNLRGTIAAARRASEKDSAGAQFFINTVDNRQLDPSGTGAFNAGYCVFGRVVEGLDVVDKIRAVATAKKGAFPGDVPVTPVVIERAQLLAD
jgi:cyclophilin family peptidyl-prolyl cis-trans isomerase